MHSVASTSVGARIDVCLAVFPVRTMPDVVNYNIIGTGQFLSSLGLHVGV